MPIVRVLAVPEVLEREVWHHARRAAPQECVGLLGGHRQAGGWEARTLYPLSNVAHHPEREYLAEVTEVLRALKAIQAEALDLVAIYHSHPHGPAQFSRTDQLKAAYDVPYLIADLLSNQMRAFWLPEGLECPVERGVLSAQRPQG